MAARAFGVWQQHAAAACQVTVVQGNALAGRPKRHDAAVIGARQRPDGDSLEAGPVETRVSYHFYYPAVTGYRT